ADGSQGARIPALRAQPARAGRRRARGRSPAAHLGARARAAREAALTREATGRMRPMKSHHLRLACAALIAAACIPVHAFEPARYDLSALAPYAKSQRVTG